MLYYKHLKFKNKIELLLLFFKGTLYFNFVFFCLLVCLFFFGNYHSILYVCVAVVLEMMQPEQLQYWANFTYQVG